MDENIHEQRQEMNKKDHSKKGGGVAGWILILLGILFLLNNYYVLDFSKFWPLILIGIGIVLILRKSF